MKVVIINKTLWNMQTVDNVTSITLSNGSITVTGSSTVTVSVENYLVRIVG